MNMHNRHTNSFGSKMYAEVVNMTTISAKIENEDKNNTSELGLGIED